MPSEHPLTFGPYVLEPDHLQLWRDKEQVRLTPKAWQVLSYLVAHPNHLVTREDLFRAVWRETVVGEATLTTCLQELRKALGDNAKAPRYIETVHRRGYRFIGKVVSSQQSVDSREEEERQKAKGKGQKAKISDPSLASTPQPPALPLVGRDADLTHLHRLLDNALAGQRQLVFVTGEPGIGKTTLTETFLFGVRSHEKFGVPQVLPELRTLNCLQLLFPGLPRGNALSSTVPVKRSYRSSTPWVVCVVAHKENRL
jgi:DNA-binding winged helix-turn-helix (wHTH) protein